MTDITADGLPDEVEREFHADIDQYNARYRSAALGGRPRLEVATAALVVTMAVAGMVTVLSRSRSLGPDVWFLLLYFCGSLIGQLRRPMFAATFLTDELVCRLWWLCGIRAPFPKFRTLRGFLVRFPTDVVAVSLLVGAVFGWLYLIERVFPLPVRTVYSGGG